MTYLQRTFSNKSRANLIEGVTEFVLVSRVLLIFNFLQVSSIETLETFVKGSGRHSTHHVSSDPFHIRLLKMNILKTIDRIIGLAFKHWLCHTIQIVFAVSQYTALWTYQNVVDRFKGAADNISELAYFKKFDTICNWLLMRFNFKKISLTTSVFLKSFKIWN